MSNELRHHGILGQKWGVRRYQNKDGTRTNAGKQRYAANQQKVTPHEDYTKAHSKGDIQTMSDKELRERLERLRMEQQYDQLSKDKVKKGEDYVNKTIKVITTTAALSSAAITIYNNAEKIKVILEKFKKG